MSGSGECPVTTLEDGVPGRVEHREAGTDELLGSFDEGGVPVALTTDSAGNVYVGDCNVRTFPCPYTFKVYDPGGAHLLSVFGAGDVIGEPSGNALAVDEGSEAPGEERPPALYAASSRGADQSAVQRFSLPAPGPLPADLEATDLEPTTATLAATLNPEGHPTHYRFQYLPRADYEAHGFAECGSPANPGCAESAEAELPGSEFESEAISAEVKELIPDTTYRLRLVAENEAGEVMPEESFTTRTAVGIEAQWASAVSARDATLEASLDPLGVEAQWWLEYDTSPYAAGEGPHGTRVGGGALPGSFGALPRGVALAGLEPATAYHYRFAAEDVRKVREGGEALERSFTTYGSERTFTTQPAGTGFPLADGRAWEMVSPSDKHGGRITSTDGGGQLQAAADGGALAYLSYGSLEADPQGNRLIEMSNQLARRAPGGAWSTTDLTAPHATITNAALGHGTEYKLFDPELGRGLMEPRECTPLAPQAGERTPYLRTGISRPAYEPLVTPANAPEAAPFGGDCLLSEAKVGVHGASPDLGHVALRSGVPLVAGAAEGALYEWGAGGSLAPVSVPPAGGPPVRAELGSGEGSVRGAVSEDGSRVFWAPQSGEGGFAPGPLYVRDTARAETLRLDEVAPGGYGVGASEARFQAASADGRYAFFTDPGQLTEDSGEEGSDLYRCELEGRRQDTSGAPSPT